MTGSAGPPMLAPVGEAADTAASKRIPWSARHPVASFLFRRTAAGLATLLVATVLIFGAVQVLPGNVAGVVLGRNATPEAVAKIEASLKLDDPVIVRYGRFLGQLVTGHFGESTVGAAHGVNLGVWPSIRTPLLNSFILAAITFVLEVPLTFGFGALAGLRAGRALDQGISTAALAFSAMPEFLVGALLIVLFFTVLNVLPPISTVPLGSTPFSDPARLVLPVLTLLLVSSGAGIRMVRANTIEVIRQDYVTWARLNGYREDRVVWQFVLRNALAPSIQTLALVAQYLMGGIIIVETLFAYNGIGNELVTAVNERDVQEIMVISTILAAIYIGINVIADLVVMLLVPRLRTQAQ
jgi:peptide/nickel transport system permease protein